MAEVNSAASIVVSDMPGLIPVAESAAAKRSSNKTMPTRSRFVEYNVLISEWPSQSPGLNPVETYGLFLYRCLIKRVRNTAE